MNYFFIAYNEPAERKNLFPEAIVVDLDPFGADIMAYFQWGRLGIQIKRVPEDFIASLEDGRLQREIEALKKLEVGIILGEGSFTWGPNNRLRIGSVERRYTKLEIENLLRSLSYIHGLKVEQSRNLQDTRRVVMELFDFLGKRDHLSLHRRPSPVWDWGVPTPQEQVVWFYQGIPDIGPVRAKALAQAFPNPAALCDASPRDVKKLKGFSSTAEKVWQFLHAQ